MEYAAVAWGRCSINNSKIKKICILLKKKTVRAVANKRYNSLSDPIFPNLGILKFHDLVNLN